MKNVFSPCRRHIIVADVDDRRTLVTQAGVDAPADPADSPVHVIALDIKAGLRPGLVERRRINSDKTGRALDGVAKTHLESVFRQRAATPDHAKDYRAVLFQVNMHPGRLIVIKFQKLGLERQRQAIDGFPVEWSRLEIIDIQIQPPDDLLGDDTGVHHQDLVGQVGRSLGDSQLPERLVTAVGVRLDQDRRAP